MARPWRIQFPDAVYHVTSRGNNRGRIFADDTDRRSFLELLEKAASRFDLEVLCFCLMSNHYHLFLRTPKSNLSQAMHWLNAGYTGRFNRRHHRVGHLLQGRYLARLVTQESHWLHLSMYIHLNPVRAGLVKNPADYPWSSCLDYTRMPNRHPWLRREAVLAEYGPDEARRLRHYRRECLALAGRERRDWEEFQRELFSVAAAQVREWAKRYKPRGDSTTVPAFNQARRMISLESCLQQVAEALGVSVEDLKKRRRNPPLRLAAYWHLVNNGGLRQAEVGRWFGVKTAAVSLGIKRLEAAKNKDKTLAQVMDRLCEM